MLYITANKPTINKYTDLVKAWESNTMLNTVTSNERLVIKGHGEGDIKWKKCWNKLLVIIVKSLVLN